MTTRDIVDTVFMTYIIGFSQRYQSPPAKRVMDKVFVLAPEDSLDNLLNPLLPLDIFIILIILFYCSKRRTPWRYCPSEYKHYILLIYIYRVCVCVCVSMDLYRSKLFLYVFKTSAKRQLKIKVLRVVLATLYIYIYIYDRS